MGSCAALIRGRAHPYTRGLRSSRAGNAAEKGGRLVAIPGAPPDLANLPPGCAFAPRCAEAIEQCRQVIPEAVTVERGHFACCIRTSAAPVQLSRAIA